MTFTVGDDSVTTDAFQFGPNCDDYGSRTIRAWQTLEDNKGKLRRNTRYVTVVRNSNKAVDSVVTFHLRKRYKCKKGRGKRQWAITFRETATFGGKVKKSTYTDEGDTFNGIRLC